jgi:hypothetical protein
MNPVQSHESKNLCSSYKNKKPLTTETLKTQRKPELKTKTFQAVAFLVFDFLCVLEQINLMMLLYFYRHQKRKRLLFRPSPDKGRTGGVGRR